MVRRYIKTKNHVRNGVTYPPYMHYGEESILQALEAVKSGRLNGNQACKRYHVPKSTLMRRIHRPELVSTGIKRQLLKPEIEKMIVNLINLIFDWHFPFTRLDLRYLAKAYLDSEGIQHTKVNDNLPGVDWTRSFQERHHKELSSSLSHGKSSNRYSSTRIINNFLENAQNVLTGVDPQCILCFDETNLTDDPNGKNFSFKRNCRYYKHFSNTSKTAFGVVLTGNASGEVLPPFLIYKGEQLWNSWKKGGPPGAKYSKSTHGWLDSNSFENWFQDIVVAYCRKLPPDIRKIIICDYLSTHFTIPVLQKCQELNIIFLCLPPRSSSTIQPLHVAFYEVFKQKWPGMLKKGTENKYYQTLPKDMFPNLINQLYQELVKDDRGKTDLTTAFSDVGLYPLNVSRVKSKLMKMESNVDFEEGRMGICEHEPGFIKVERLFFPADDDDLEVELDDADHSEEAGVVCTEEDPLAEREIAPDEPSQFLIEDVIWELEPTCDSNEVSTSYPIEDVRIKEEIVTIELTSDDDEPFIESASANHGTESVCVPNEIRGRVCTTDGPDEINQRGCRNYSTAESGVTECTVEAANVTGLVESSPSRSFRTKALGKSRMTMDVNNDLRRKYMKLRKAYTLKCEEVRRLKSCLNLYLNGLSVKKKWKKR